MEDNLFNIYISGVLYGKLKLQGGKPEIAALNIETGLLKDFEPVQEKTNFYYKALTKIDLLKFCHTFEIYKALQGTGTFKLSNGETYTSENGKAYVQREIKFPNNIIMEGGKLIAVICPARELVTVMVKDGFENKTILKEWNSHFKDEKIYGVKYLGMFDVPMRDGIKLSTDVYLPANLNEKIPAVLVRTPYGKDVNQEMHYRYVQRGYAVVIQDVRGKNLSEGEWVPFHNETEDGEDTLNWIAEQPWSDKKVGTIGGSYLGYVQWAAAASANPYLKAMISVVCAGSAFVDNPRRGGCLVSGTLAWAFTVSQKKYKVELAERDDWDDILNIRPLTDIPQKALGYDVPFITQWLETSDDTFWKKGNWHDRSKGAEIPALIQSGWFDDNGMGTTEALELVKDFAPENRKVILGPWQHGGNNKYDMHGISFGENALRYDLDLIYFRWFEYHLKGIKNGIDKMPNVQYYTLSENQWKEADAWPIPQGKTAELYFTSDGTANVSLETGKLVWTKPEKETYDEYLYDPKNPATHIIDMSENELEVPEDYTEEEKRNDIVCYSTETLTEDITITGDLMAYLYISSDAVDTDFVVRLTDVDEKGRSIKLADGFMDAKYRNGFEKTDYLEKDKVELIKIRTTKISNCFRKGHKIRVTVTSSAKNFIFPNGNTKNGYNEQNPVTAKNRIHCGGTNSSKIVFTVE